MQYLQQQQGWEPEWGGTSRAMGGEEGTGCLEGKELPCVAQRVLIGGVPRCHLKQPIIQSLNRKPDYVPYLTHAGPFLNIS